VTDKPPNALGDPNPLAKSIVGGAFQGGDGTVVGGRLIVEAELGLNRSAAEAYSRDEPISARATNPRRVRRAEINWRCPLAFRDAGRQRGLVVPLSFAGECPRLIAPTHGDAALMILLHYCA
jgi:hypothetical protein